MIKYILQNRESIDNVCDKNDLLLLQEGLIFTFEKSRGPLIKMKELNAYYIADRFIIAS